MVAPLPPAFLWSIAKTLDMLVSLQVFGDALTDDSCSDTMNDVYLRHVIEQGLVDKGV